jgi:hypothetical protein
MKNNKFFSILITLFILVIVGCSFSVSEIPVTGIEEETPEVNLTKTPTLEPTVQPTQVPSYLQIDFSWTEQDMGPHIGQHLHPPIPYDDVMKYLEDNRKEGYNFYLYAFDIHGVGLDRTFGPTDYLITGPVCQYFRSMDIVDDLLCDKIIESKSKRFFDEEDPLYDTWVDDLEVDNDSIIFITVEDDHNCFFWKEGGVNLIQKDGSVLFFDDEDIPFDKFTSEEIEKIGKGYTLIDRREEPFSAKCNFFDLKEEITIK